MSNIYRDDFTRENKRFYTTEELRELGVGSEAYFTSIESQKLVEEEPEKLQELDGYDGLLYVGRAPNGKIIVIADDEDKVIDHLLEEGLLPRRLN